MELKLFTIQCNKCFAGGPNKTESAPTLQFYFSNCSHILCQNCVRKECPICARHFTPNLISTNMSTSMTTYFDNPMKLFEHSQKVLKFQLDQLAIQGQYKVYEFPQRLVKLQKERNKILQLDSTLSAKLEKEKKRIEKLKIYIAYHERQFEQPHNMNPAAAIGAHRENSTSGISTLTNSSVPHHVVGGSNRLAPQTPTLSDDNSAASNITNGGGGIGNNSSYFGY